MEVHALMRQHLLHGCTSRLARDRQRRRLRRVDRQLDVVTDVTRVEEALQQHRALIGRRRALVQQIADGYCDTAALKPNQLSVELRCAFQRVEGMRVGQARDSFEIQGSAQRDDQIVILDLAIRNDDLFAFRVDLFDLARDHLDLLAFQTRDVAADRVGLTIARHDPQIGGRERLLGVAFSHDDVGLLLQLGV